MAIVSMKKMRLLALKRDKGRILRQLQKMGCVELIQEDQAPEQKALPAEDGRLQSVREEVARLDRAVDELKPLCRGGSLLAVKPEKSEDDAMQAMASEGETLAVVDRLEETARGGFHRKTEAVGDTGSSAGADCGHEAHLYAPDYGSRQQLRRLRSRPQRLRGPGGPGKGVRRPDDGLRPGGIAGGGSEAL